jgi:hypothetical protein
MISKAVGCRTLPDFPLDQITLHLNNFVAKENETLG